MFLEYDTKIEVASKVSEIIMKDIFKLETEFELRSYLKSKNLEELTPSTLSPFIPNGNIYILGDLKIKEHHIYQIFKELNVNVDRIKIINEYNKFKKFNFNRFQHDTSTRIIFVGPIPHSTQDKDEHNSVINRMETEEGFPKIIRLGVEGTLKVTKSNLKDAIIKEIESGYLDIN